MEKKRWTINCAVILWDFILTIHQRKFPTQITTGLIHGQQNCTTHGASKTGEYFSILKTWDRNEEICTHVIWKVINYIYINVWISTIIFYPWRQLFNDKAGNDIQTSNGLKNWIETIFLQQILKTKYCQFCYLVFILSTFETRNLLKKAFKVWRRCHAKTIHEDKSLLMWMNSETDQITRTKSYYDASIEFSHNTKSWQCWDFCIA